ncbi:NAD(P)H-binding protein [Tianweitania sediminis]|uniref:NAD(P)H-binding protein n=1 Tax=Tianweitania sediminis TaxID=1502156 RepID=A0A8J7UHF1_9HYPH|nr:NAD(P)H-binding protein [Tianweitania sediminis]MBP0437748.1 NAD(P)H-binding protein [Tianweitania sediminis]
MAEKARTALVLGATGGVGGAVTRALLADGWEVCALVRDPKTTVLSWRGQQPRWIAGDAMEADAVLRAAEGVGVMFHGVNPPGYRDWDKLVLPMIDNTIAAAIANNARIVLPGTIYNFNPEQVAVINEDSPQQPSSRKGKIRREMEHRLERASATTPVLILRAGDFFGADARQSWFTQAMAPGGAPLKRILKPVVGRSGHAWAYLPDLASTFVQLMNMGSALRPFERVQFEGVWDADGTMMVEAIRSVVAKRMPVWGFPWWAMGLAAPFGGFPREAWELRTHWQHSMRLDNQRLLALLGKEPRTPLLQAVHATLVGTGALPQDAPSHQALLAA